MGRRRGYLTALGGGVAAWPVLDPHAHARSAPPRRRRRSLGLALRAAAPRWRCPRRAHRTATGADYEPG